jgi:hypothetical protein
MSDGPPPADRAAERLGPTPAQITMMSHNISAVIDRRASRRRRRLRAATAGVGLAALLGAAITAGTMSVSRAPEQTLDDTFDCFVTPDPGGVVSRVSFLDEVTEEYGSRREFALELCETVYRNRGTDVPNPTVCELPNLRLAVFPNAGNDPDDEFCTALGLGPAGD